VADREIVFLEVERFVAGTVGEPGERAFFLQVRGEKRLVTMAIEKIQVQALSDRVGILLREIRISQPLLAIPSTTDDSAPLDMPIVEEFSVGEIAISFESEKQTIDIELTAILENTDEDATSVLLSITLSQAASFVKRSNYLVAAGRSSCPFCGGPINKGGHLCPRANGYRR
jgi:uncharacterized repeat protein (TIGR03847 family)